MLITPAFFIVAVPKATGPCSLTQEAPTKFKARAFVLSDKTTLKCKHDLWVIRP